jgi:uncharacterized glyoxalase superfamily protein PhnB
VEALMKLTGLTPNLLCQDIHRSLAFYRDVLGFTVSRTVPDEQPFVFAWMVRDGVNVFLNDAAVAKAEAPAAEGLVAGTAGVALFLHVEGIHDWWASVRDRAPVVMALKTQWYGQTEFSITDPDGYVVTCAERAS